MGLLKQRTSEGGLGSLLHDLSRGLRSDAVPAVLRDAASTVANVLDGAGQSQGSDANGAVVINVSIAVAVGTPGKEQGADADGGESTPNEAVTIATAVAAPATRKRSASTGASDASRATTEAADGASSAR